MGFGAEGPWKPSGVNPCFRISRYLPGATGMNSDAFFNLYQVNHLQMGYVRLPEGMAHPQHGCIPAMFVSWPWIFGKLRNQG